MVKWTTLDLCMCLSESDSELYTNFKMFVKKIINISKKNIKLQSQSINVDKKKSSKNLHILEDGASSV